MAEYLSPGVYVEEFDSGPAPMQGVSTSTAGFVGLAEKGPVSGAPVFVTGISDFHRKFGGYLQKSEFGEYRYLAHAVSHFFANGGARAFVMRVAPSNAAVASLSCGEGLRFEAKNPGAWGNRIIITMAPASKGKSQIMEDLGEGKYTLKSAEEFYAGDVVVLEGPDGAEYGVVAQVDGKNITMASPFQSAQVVDQALLPQVTIKTCEMNMEIRCEDMAESYENVSFNITTPYFIEKMLSKSELVNVTAQAVEEAKAPVELVKEWTGCEKEEVRLQLSGGLNGTAAALSDGDFIGVDKGPGERTGIQAFLDNSDVSIMAVPGITSPNVQLSLVAHCENLGSRFAVLDMPKEAKSVDEIMKHRNIVDSDYCAMYHPWLEVYDPLDKRNTYIPPSGSVMGIYARSDNSRGIHKAPANETVMNCTGDRKSVV